MAIAYDSTATGISASSPATFSHTCSGSNRILFVAACANNGQTVTGVTYAGVSMTQIGSKTDSAGATEYLFYLIAPATGANNVVVTTSGSNATGSSVSYTGVAQSGIPDASVVGSESTATSKSQALTSIADNCWFVATTRTGNGNTLTADSGTTIRQQPENTYLGANTLWDSNGATTPAGSKTLGVTSSNQLFGGVIMASFRPVEITTSLVSYWKLDESSGTAVDAVGTYNMTNSNTTYSTGKINNGGVFNGTTSYLYNASFVRPTNITLSAWINKSNKTGAQTIIGGDDVASGGAQRSFQFGTEATTGKAEVIIFNVSTLNDVVGTTDVCDGTWHHICATYDAVTTRLYVDGILQNTDAVLTGNIRAGTGIAIGVLSDAEVSQFYNGSLDEVGIWSRALTADEVSQLANSNRALAYPLATPTLYGGISYWKLDESSGNATDSIRGNTLTNNNTATYSSGKINNGVDLEFSSSQSLSITDASQVGLDFSSTVSFSVWVKLEQLGSDNARTYGLITKGDFGTPSYSYTLRISDTDVLYAIFSDDGTQGAGHFIQQTADAATFTGGDVGVWRHILMTADIPNETVTFYKDGSLVASTKTGTIGSSIYNNAIAFRVGAELTSGTPAIFFDGMMDEIALFNRILTSTEIAELYSSGSGKQYPWTGTLYSLVCAAGSYVLTGSDILFNKTLRLVMAAGSYTLTGIDIAFRRGYGLICSAGSYILSGLPVTFSGQGEWRWTKRTKNTSSYASQTKNTSIWTNDEKN